MSVQLAMSEHLKALEMYNISTIPKVRLSWDQLAQAAATPEAAETLFNDLKTLLKGRLPLLCIVAESCPPSAAVHLPAVVPGVCGNP